jgi:hypothetical protein
MDKKNVRVDFVIRQKIGEVYVDIDQRRLSYPQARLLCKYAEEVKGAKLDFVPKSYVK